MALAVHLRRAMSLSSSLLKDRRCLVSFSSSSSNSYSSSSSPFYSRSYVTCSPFRTPIASSEYSQILSRSFRSSAVFGRQSNFADDGEGRTIGPDEILFEGCDYNHWLITMDFPKDPKPSPEEMVETYVQTLAKVVGSVEEAKKRMYACSTTTYNGFQAVMTEEMSEKFRGLPGVVFILPDSYIDPVNKEYGGDKYDNGVITPRPPPFIGRPNRGNRNRNFDGRNERQRDSMPAYDRRPQDSGNYNQPPNYGQQQWRDTRGGYGPPGNRDFGSPGVRNDFGQPRDGRDFGPPPQRDFNQGGNFTPQQREFNQGGNFSPQQREFNQGGGNYAPQQREFNQGGNYTGPTPHREFNQSSGQFVPEERRQYPQQGQGGDYRAGGAPVAGQHGQGWEPGYSGDQNQGSGPRYNFENRQGFHDHFGENVSRNNQASGTYGEGSFNPGGQQDPHRQGSN